MLKQVEREAIWLAKRRGKKLKKKGNNVRCNNKHCINSMNNNCSKTKQFQLLLENYFLLFLPN